MSQSLAHSNVGGAAQLWVGANTPGARKRFRATWGGIADWAGHDASASMLTQARPPFPAGILIDQGLADPFLATQLLPEAFESACLVAGQNLTLRRHAAYDHGCYFIASFIEDHLRHHAAQLLV